jgi:tetratricopeptide (TPR) repeat protein
MRGPSRIVAILLMWALGAPCAHAAETEADRKRRAKAFVEEGNSKYDLGKYDDAIGLYEQAFEIWPHPETLFNLCQAYRQKKDLERAVFYCKSYLRNDPASPKRETVEARIVEMEQAIDAAKQTVEKPPKGVQPAEEPVQKARPVVPVAAEEPPRWYADPLAWSFVAGGVVLLGGGSWLLASAESLRDEGDAALTPERMDVLYDRADTRETFGWVAGGVGVAVVVAGVVKLVVHEPSTERLSLRPSAGGMGIVWSGSF